MRQAIKFLLLTAMFLAVAPAALCQGLDTYNNRGLAKVAKGDFDGAIADFNRAIQLKPAAK